MIRSHHVLALLFSSFSMTACDGSGEVVVSGLDDFGSVRSAQWVLSAPFSIVYWSDGELVDEGLVSIVPLTLRSWNRSCNDEKNYFERWGQLSQAVIEADGDEAQCEAMGELVTWRNSESNRPEESSVFSVYSYAIETTDLPEEGSYPADESAGILAYQDATGCEDALVWDAETCSIVTCSEWKQFRVQAAEFVIESVTDSRVVGTFSGSVMIDDDHTGTVDAEFDAEVCEITIPSALVL